jgi:hypothetical protein
MFRGIVEDDGTGIDDSSGVVVERLALGNFPDPFNPLTHVGYELPHSARVTLRVYDPSGRLVRELLDSVEHDGGVYSVPWDGRSDSGQLLPSGVYFARLEAGREVAVNKMVLLK